MSELKEYISEQLKNPEFEKAWKESEGEYQAMRAVILARNKTGITQKELAKATQIPQKTISLIENGNTNTTVRTLAKIAQGLGKELKIEIV